MLTTVNMIFQFALFTALAAAMPTMYTKTTTLRIQIINFADHTRLVIKTLTVKIWAHCGQSYKPLPLDDVEQTMNGLSSALASKGGKWTGQQLGQESNLFTTVEKATGLLLLTTAIVMGLLALTYLGALMYHSIDKRVEYSALKQEEAGEDEEQRVEAAPQYTPRPDIASTE